MNLTAKQFDLDNARACAAASVAAYGRSPLSGAVFAGAVARSVEVPETDTHALVIEMADGILIAFRGTDSIRDWITDAQFLRTELLRRDYQAIAEVHTGFLQAFDSIIKPLSDQLKKIVVGSRPIFVTGHSLGGALAILCALELQRQNFSVAQVYTFGQPRVGNGGFKKIYEAALGDRTFRVVYQEDIVARVPHLPKLHDPYRHVGAEIFLPSDESGTFIVNPSLWRLLLSDAWGVYRAFTVSKFAAAIDPIRDHHVANYTRTLEEITQ